MVAISFMAILGGLGFSTSAALLAADSVHLLQFGANYLVGGLVGAGIAAIANQRRRPG